MVHPISMASTKAFLLLCQMGAQIKCMYGAMPMCLTLALLTPHYLSLKADHYLHYRTILLFFTSHTKGWVYRPVIWMPLSDWRVTAVGQGYSCWKLHKARWPWKQPRRLLHANLLRLCFPQGILTDIDTVQVSANRWDGHSVCPQNDEDFTWMSEQPIKLSPSRQQQTDLSSGQMRKEQDIETELAVEATLPSKRSPGEMVHVETIKSLESL